MKKTNKDEVSGCLYRLREELCATESGVVGGSRVRIA